MRETDDSGQEDESPRRRSRFTEISTYDNNFFKGVGILLVNGLGLGFGRMAIEAALEPEYNNWKFVAFVLASALTSIAYGAILFSKDESPARRSIHTVGLVLISVGFDFGFWMFWQRGVLGALLSKL